jgi:hypothetical protein
MCLGEEQEGLRLAEAHALHASKAERKETGVRMKGEEVGKKWGRT